MAEIARIEDLVAERIRKDFIELIPKEQFDRLVQAQINEFTTSKGSYDKSPLGRMISAEIASRFGAMVKAELDKPEWQNQFSEHGYIRPSDAVRVMLMENMAEIFLAAHGAMVQRATDSLRSALGHVLSELEGQSRGSTY